MTGFPRDMETRATRSWAADVIDANFHYISLTLLLIVYKQKIVNKMLDM